MEVFDPRVLIKGPLFKESEFREAVERFDWSRFQGKPVLVQGCASIMMPPWSYMMITARLVPIAKSVHYGETKSPIPVFGALGREPVR